MTDKAVDLDKHREMAAQKATDLRRLLAEVVANERALRATQDELEAQLIAAPASTWEEDAAATSWVSSKTPWCSRKYIWGDLHCFLRVRAQREVHAFRQLDFLLPVIHGQIGSWCQQTRAT